MPPRDRVLNVMSMGDIDPSYQLASVAEAPNLTFYAGTPITSEHGVNIGIVSVVDGSMRKELSAREGLQVDDVMFPDGLAGFHGSVQPVAEQEKELEHEVEQRPHRKPDD
ncbi:hypothetical protein B0T12DRAFT_393817 [Alternaria alternata]|nr:hypothetical protein B0T12DRAFT_393817 [Alternaria alternata]